jgi:heme exporter protein D
MVPWLTVGIVCGMAYFVIRGTANLIRARGFGRFTLFLTSLFVIGGLAFGWWLTNRRYHLSPELQVIGFPVPVAFLKLENGHWTDFIACGQVFAFFTNLLAGITLCLLPLTVVARVLRKNQVKAKTC